MKHVTCNSTVHKNKEQNKNENNLVKNEACNLQLY